MKRQVILAGARPRVQPTLIAFAIASLFTVLAVPQSIAKLVLPLSHNSHAPLLEFLLPKQPIARAQTPVPSGGALYLPLVTTGAMDDATHPDHEVEAPTVWRIYFNSADDLTRLSGEIDIWEEAIANQNYVHAILSDAQIEMLQQGGFRIEQSAEQTQKLADALTQIQGATTAAINTIPGFACYRTVEETYAALAQLAAAHPQLATWTDIGNSWDKATAGGNPGYDLYALVLTNRSTVGSKPKFMLMAAIHAREYTTAELATRFAEHLVTNYNLDADITWLLDHYEVHIIPHVNPDGRKIAEGGILWRKNVNNTNGCFNSSQWGVDLNRNSSFQWGLPGASSSACSATYRGSSAASEPEVQAIQNYASSIFPDQRGPNLSDPAPADAEGLFISLHSYSELVLFPWGWSTTPTPNLAGMQTLGRKFGYFNDYQVCNGPTCLYATSGTTDDWTYGELGVASFTFELGTDFFQQCSVFENTIYPDNLPALLYAFKAARRPYQNPAGPDAMHLNLSSSTVAAGTAVTLNATINDTRYDSNGWGTEASQNIQAARYTVDTPSWKGGSAQPMSAADGSYNATVESVSASIDTSGLSAGRHIIFVEGQDSAGNWGVPSAIFLTIAEGTGPTPTPTNTAAPTNTPTNTPLPTNTPTPTHTPSPTNTPVAGACTTYASTDLPKGLPVGTASTSSNLLLSGGGVIDTLKLDVDMNHAWVGDLSIRLVHQESGTSVTVLDRPGIPASTWGCSSSNIMATFEDGASTVAENQCRSTVPAIFGNVKPNQPLANFQGEAVDGVWQLVVTDGYVSADGGTLNSWSLEVCTDGAAPTATNTALPTHTSTATNTATATPIPPTATNTPLGSTPTPSPTATATNTAVTPTATPVSSGSAPYLETGVAVNVSSNWTTIHLGRSYSSMVVVASPNYNSSSAPAVVRIRNASGSSFEMRVQSATSSPVAVSANVHYMVVEEGVYTVAAHGVKMEAAKFSSTITNGRYSNWNATSRSYANSYSNPVVVGQVMTSNDAGFSTFWSHGANRSNPPSASSLRLGKQVAEDVDTTRANETVGYIVIEAGNGAMGDVSYVAGLGSDTVLGIANNPPQSYALSGLTSASTAIVSQAAMNGTNGGWAVLYGPAPLTANRLDLTIDEDQIRDSERGHATEQVAYIVFE